MLASGLECTSGCLFKRTRALALVAAAALLLVSAASFAAPVEFADERPSALMPSTCEPTASQAQLTLPEVLERALCAQPATRRAVATWQASRAMLAQAQAAQRPSLSANASTQHADTSLRGATSTVGAELRLSYLLFDAGRTSALVQAAERDSLAAQMQADDEGQAVLLEASRRYLQAIASGNLERAARVVLQAAELAHSAAQARMSAGETVRLDVLQAQARRAQAKLALVRAQRERELAHLTLAQYIGAPFDAPLQLAELHETATETPPALSEALSQLDEHPMLRVALHRAEGARARETAAQAQGKPTLSVQANVAAQNDRLAGASHTGAVALQLSIPLYDAGLAQAQRAAARAQAQVAQENVEAAHQELPLSVAQQYTQLRAARAELASSEALLDAATLAEEHAAGRYRAGVGLLLEWLDAQSRLAQARTEHVIAQNGVLFSRWALARALGELTTDSFSAKSPRSSR